MSDHRQLPPVLTYVLRILDRMVFPVELAQRWPSSFAFQASLLMLVSTVIDDIPKFSAVCRGEPRL